LLDQRAIDLRFAKLDGKVKRRIQDVLKSYAPPVKLQKYSAWTLNFRAKLLVELRTLNLIAPAGSERLNASFAPSSHSKGLGSGCAGEYERFVVMRQKLLWHMNREETGQYGA